MDTSILLSIIVGLLPTLLYGEGKIRLLLLNKCVQGTCQSNAHFKCYVSKNDTAAIVTTRRGVNTKNRDYSGQPRLTRESTSEYIIGVPQGIEQFGVFSCTATLDGKDNTTVQTMFLTSYAEIESRDKSLTKTVNIGDVGVAIKMKKSIPNTNRIQWRKDNSEPLQGRSNLIYQIENYVTTASEGIYECHYQHRRNAAPHGLQRLLVRGCRANHWGPPDCFGICDNCYNGGVCDDETGECICPAGFKGANCLEACEGKFGYNCEFDCENNEDPGNVCRGSMFCLMDPYGCQCSPGYEGLNCSTRCTGNKFGANCLQQCHCNNEPCNVFTGSCDRGCQDGYEGESCQIPTGTCKIGYYGSQCIQKCHCKDNEACNKTTGSCPSECARGYAVVPGMKNCEECQEGYFGETCQHECHCEGACNHITGDCTNKQCKTQWKQDWTPTCQTGVAFLTFDKTNPNASTTFNCTLSSPSRLSQIHGELYRDHPFEVSSTISNVSSWLSTTSTKTTQFRVTNVKEGDTFYCVLATGSGERTVVHTDTYLERAVTLYTLPKLNVAPVVLSKNSFSVTISWKAWKESVDYGDGPVVSYIPYCRRSNTFIGLNKSVVNHDSSSIFQAHFSDLDADSEYSFSVAVVRPGLFGEGEKSPEIRATTSCLPPLSPPVDIRLTQPQIGNGMVNMSWKLPERSYVRCRSGVRLITIYYHQRSEEKEAKLANVTNPRVTFVKIQNLKIGTTYTFTATLSTNGGESNRSVNHTLTLRGETSNSGKGSEGIHHIPARDSSASPLLTAVIIMTIIDAILGSYFAFLVIRSKQRQHSQNGFDNTSIEAIRGTSVDNLKPDVATTSKQEPTYQNW